MAQAFAFLACAAFIASNLAWIWRLRRERREADRALSRLQDSERSLQTQIARDRAGQSAIFDCMIEGLLVLDPFGRIHLANRALHRLFSLSGDILGRTLVEALQRHELDDVADRARQEGQALDLTLEVGGINPRIIQVNATTYEPGGASGRGVILVFRDVTRLRELENTRREFVANVSHELRTPLALIKGFVETLIDGARHDPEVTLRFLQTIEKHTNRLTFLIEDLLTISQLESGQVVLNRQRGEIQPLVDRVLEDFAARSAARGTRLVNTIPSDLQLHADFDRLQQVFFNLIDNAIKYGRQGGVVTLGADLRPDQSRVDLWIHDDGPGIPPESLERVFERFYRVNAARSREQGGTGLGLSIVKHIVQAHGGEVRAESEPNKGTRFRLSLPWQTPDPSALPLPSDGRESG